ncbi:MAG: VOC family protein, partial [Anaerolineae bacterium]|nr:VOC family protein [Anaerolineae bacterium]
GGDVYLEVIAINPEAPAPSRPRWFSLDDPFIRARLNREPTLLTWVINTPDVAKLLRATPFPFGSPEPMHRGELRWLFTLLPDGHLPAAGFLPTIIEWQTQPHPSGRMADPGCRLTCLTIHHPQLEWLGNILTAIGAARLVTLQPLPPQAGPYFTAEFKTPGGDVQIFSNLR